MRATTDDSVLADPETWRGETEYNKGALVLGVLDHEIRVATDGERTLQDVLRRMNADPDPTLDTFIRTVGEVGGPDAAAAAERYITTSAAPDYRPDEARLAELYDGSSTGLNASPRTRTRILSVATTGTNGTRQFDPESEHVQVPPGQTVRIRGPITNVGDTGGLARVAVRETSDGTTSRIETPWVGWLRPQVTVTRNETLQFSRPGTYEIVWGDRQITVTVAPERGTASVIGLNATLNRGAGQVTVDAVVRNDADLPTFVELPVSVNGQRLTTARAVVDGSATRTVTVSLNTSQQAPYRLSIGDARTTIGQREGTSRPDTGPDIPLLPVLGVLGTLALLGAVAARRIGSGR